LRFIGFSGDTPPITGDDLPREKGAKMYVIHKMQRSPWKRKGNGHEDDRQSPRAGLPTARFAIFVIVSKEVTNGYASIFQRPQKLLRNVARRVGSHSAWTVQFDEASREVETGLGPQNAEKSVVAEKEWGLRSAKPHELHFALPRETHYVRQKAWGAWPENSPRHLPTERDCCLNRQSHQLRIYHGRITKT